MKILMVNKFFYRKGGSETYFFSLKNLLESHGHKVIDFSMKDEKNFDSPYKDYFVDNVDYNTKQSLGKKVSMAMNIIYSREAKKKFEKLVLDTKPDIIHLHIFQHQISPSILDVAKKYNIPVIYTAHDLKMLCPDFKMLTHGRICEDCKNGRYINCLKNKCVKDSYSKSMINVIEGYVHKIRKSYDAVTTIITPSEFYRKKFIEYGISEDRVVHVANFLEPTTYSCEREENYRKYFLYLGRLSEEKGILTLVKAAKISGLPVYIAGNGPLEETIKTYIEENNISNVKLLGFKTGQTLKNIVYNANAVVLPSEWYENGPYAAIESLEMGKPIIGSDLGGIPELIDGNGYVFEHGNAEKLAEALKNMAALSDDDYNKMSDRSKTLFESDYSAQNHYQKIMDIYEKAFGKCSNKVLAKV